VPERPVTAAREAPATEGRLGLRVAPLTAELAQEYRYARPGGLVIVEVQPYGAAGRKGLDSGLKITAVDGQRVSTPQEFDRILRSKNAGEIVSLAIETPDGTSAIQNIRIPR